MPRTIVARDGDTLCGIAIREGFLDCKLLRDEEGNKPYLDRRLRAGDKVVLPDPREKTVDKPATKSHRFKRKRLPEPSIRFVHGSKDKAFEADGALTRVSISNFV